MAKITMDYLRTLAQIVDQLGLKEPKIASEQRDDGVFHATIEVDLNSWVHVGFRGPREFAGTSSISGKKAIRKAARDVVSSLERFGLVTIDDFSSKKLDLWKERVMNIAKICKEVAEERDELERDSRYLKRKQGMLLAENARLKAKISRLEKKASRCTRDEEQSKATTDDDNILIKEPPEALATTTCKE